MLHENVLKTLRIDQLIHKWDSSVQELDRIAEQLKKVTLLNIEDDSLKENVQKVLKLHAEGKFKLGTN